jgi:hypothetical protein
VRAVVARAPAMESSRSRRRLGSHRRAGCSGSARVCIQAVISQASATTAHQIRFWSRSRRGRLARPVSFAARIRSSQRARRRWRSSRSGSWGAGPAGGGVGGERGDPVPVHVGDPQLGAEVGPFLADDDPHPGRPVVLGQVQQVGQFGDPQLEYCWISSLGRWAALRPGCPGRSAHTTWQWKGSAPNRPVLVAALKLVPGRKTQVSAPSPAQVRWVSPREESTMSVLCGTCHA